MRKFRLEKSRPSRNAPASGRARTPAVLRALPLLLAAILLGPVLTRAASITLLSGDGLGTTAFTGATNWSNATVPNSANNYFTAAFGMRSPADANNYTFAGHSLTLQNPTTTGYSFIYKGTAGANTYTINNLTNSGGLIRSGAGSGNTCVLAGTMVVAANSTVTADQSPFIISANLGGAGTLTNLNPGPQTYGTVTYSGTNAAFTGEFLLGNNAILIFGNPHSVPGNPASPNPGQITLGAGSTLEDLAGVSLNNANGGITLAGAATIYIPATNVATTIAVPVTDSSGSLTKTGSGTLYLDAANSYPGATTVSAGTLAGTGSFSGPVTVAATGNLGAGDAGTTVGTLTVNNTLTLQGNTTLRVNNTGGLATNDVVTVNGSLAYGGILTVPNATTDGTLFTTNNAFQLFNVTATVSGNFTGIVGSPGPGLVYTFNPTNGVLGVAAALIHRYSFFQEPAGSLVATDSIAGANGSLAGSAAITGGKLVLNGASGTYASLPGGLITGYSAVTLEAWADYGSLPANCYLFSLGLTDSGGNGGNYIFCAPQSARITISSTDPGYNDEQNATCNGWSGRTNLHVVAIFDPPAGFLAIYTNGCLAGINNAVTNPLSAVSNVLSCLGRSLYTSDPCAPVNIAEFRIWNGALSPAQIAMDAVSGPGQIIADPGPLQALHLTVPSPLAYNEVYAFAPGGTTPAIANLQATGGPQPATVTGDFTNLTGVNLLAYGPPTFSSGNTNILTVSTAGVVTPVASGTTTISATFGGLSATQTVTTIIATNTFVFDTFGDGFWNLINEGNSNTLVVSGSGATQSPPTNGTTAQQFEMLYNPQGKNFRIRQESSWLCLGSTSGTKVPGTAVTTVSYSGTLSQQWNLLDAGGGYFRIVNAATNLVLQTDNGSPASVTLQTSNATPYQLWKFVYQAHYPKKGIAGYEGDYAQFELNWACNYDDHTSVNLPAQVNFAPMIHDASWEPVSDVTSRSAGWRTQAAPDYLLTYNEPDNTAQADMTTAQTLGLWPSLQALNVPLVGPGTQNIEDSWENTFYSLVTSNRYRVDYSAVHDYVPPSASSLISNLRSVYNAYGRPVWLTEFSPVDWNGNQGWTEDDDYNFLAEFMWQAEDQDWLRRYAIFPFSGTNPLPPYQATTAGYRGNFFLADGATLAPYGELFATWDADRLLHPGIPYIIHNLATSFRLADTNTFSAPQASTLYTRNATTEWALLAAPTTSHYYIISLNDGRRVSDTAGTVGLQPVGTVGSAVEWTFTGPDSSGYYFIGNPAGGHNLNGSGTAPAITFNTTSSGTQNNNTRWRLVKPYQPVTINTNATTPTILYAAPGSGSVSLGWTGGGVPFYNVYRAGVSGGPYTRLATVQSQTTFQDNTVTNGVPYYYVLTSMSILGQESARSAEAAALPTALTPPNIAFSLTGSTGLQLAWPGDHTGWRLQVQTNALTDGLDTNWQDIAGASATNQVQLSIDPANGAVFYRMVYP